MFRSFVGSFITIYSYHRIFIFRCIRKKLCCHLQNRQPQNCLVSFFDIGMHISWVFHHQIFIWFDEFIFFNANIIFLHRNYRVEASTFLTLIKLVWWLNNLFLIYSDNFSWQVQEMISFLYHMCTFEKFYSWKIAIALIKQKVNIFIFAFWVN